jgi:hypothetical protein
MEDEKAGAERAKTNEAHEGQLAAQARNEGLEHKTPCREVSSDY